eukprot:gene29455-biopygen5378
MHFLVHHGSVQLHPEFLSFVMENREELDRMIVTERDVQQHTFFAVKTLERSYLLRSFDDRLPIESPQDMWLRVAIALNLPEGDARADLSRIRSCYTGMSTGLYTHATPTLFNAGTKHPQCSSCYLLGTEDSMDGIWTTLKNSAMISKWAGGIGRRKGSLAAYLEPWHADVWEFVELRRNTGSETERARDIFLALWVPDEFMRRVEADEDWFLMSPDECPGLVDAVGNAFSDLYNRYVGQKKFVRSIRARTLWHHIVSCQLETVVNAFVVADSVTGMKIVDHVALHRAAREVACNLNNLIDRSMYPVPETRKNNISLRPIGIGVQGMGDLYCLLSLPYESQGAMDVDHSVMETIYHGAMEMSIDMAEARGRPYDGFEGSPLSQGKFQFDLWGHTPSSGCYDWEAMRKRIMVHGALNSLLTALMPTASTSQILGNCECFEPFQSNVYKRTTLAGEFMVINTHLVRTLSKLGLWGADMRKRIIMNNGSVQDIIDIPDDVRTLYKTVWEIPQRSIIDHAIARGPFVCQSQSMNLFMAQPSFIKLSSALMYAWKGGLKTGMYYLRSNAAVEAQRISDINPDPVLHTTENGSTNLPVVGGVGVCTEEVCMACSS